MKTRRDAISPRFLLANATKSVASGDPDRSKNNTAEDARP